MKTDALIVVDVQNDFCPGGALAVPDGDSVVAVINRLMGQFEHIVLTQDWHPHDHRSFASQHPGRDPFAVIDVDYGAQVLWPDHCVQGSTGAALHRDLATDNADLVIRKGCRRGMDSYSAFYENDKVTPTGLSGYLQTRGLRRLFLAGLATDFCVHYSAMDGVREGFEVFLIEDGSRGIDLDGSLEAARRAMAAAGVHTTTSDQLETVLQG